MNVVNGLWQIYEDLMTHIHHTQMTLNRLYLRADSIEHLLSDHLSRTNNMLTNRRYIIRPRTYNTAGSSSNGSSEPYNVYQSSSIPLSSSNGSSEPYNVQQSSSIPLASTNNVNITQSPQTDNSGSDLLEQVISNFMASYMSELSQSSVSNTGMSSSEINRYITSSEYRDLHSPNITTCPITMEPLLPNTQVMIINSCGHIFSESGIRPWLTSHRQCPVCRRDIG